MENVCWAPFPVTFEPNWTDEWLFWATVASVVASGAVAFLAWRTSLDAKEIAAMARTTQENVNADSLAAEHNTQLNAAIAAFLRQVASFRSPIMSYLAECERVEIANDYDPMTGELRYPRAPSLESISLELEIIYLIANSDDLPVIKKIDSTLDSIANTQPYRQWPLLIRLMKAIRQWRSQAFTEEKTIAALKYIHNQARLTPSTSS